MASTLAASSCRACQRAGTGRRAAAKAFTAAVPRPGVCSQQQRRAVQLRVAAEVAAPASGRGAGRSGSIRQPPWPQQRPLAARRQAAADTVASAFAAGDVIDLDSVSLTGPSPAGDAPADAQEWSLEQLAEAAANTHFDSLEVAEIEAAFLEGTADEETSGYLASLRAEADALLMGGRGRGAEAATAQVAAAAAELLEAGDVPEAQVTEELGVAPLGSAQRDVLEGLSNEEAIAARKVVAALKLSKQELQEHLLPEDWDATQVDWFTEEKGEELPLPEYKLVFLWMDKNIAVAVDQVYARGNSSPLTEFFVWPRKDAWEELKLALEARPWISDRDKVLLLNRLTEVINFWMGANGSSEVGPDGQPVAPPRPSIDEARVAFADCAFSGSL